MPLNSNDLRARLDTLNSQAAAIEEELDRAEATEAAVNDQVVVKVGRIPGPLTDVVLNGDHTVAGALHLANVSAPGAGEGVYISGTKAEMDDVVSDGDRVYIARMVKGNRK